MTTTTTTTVQTAETTTITTTTTAATTHVGQTGAHGYCVYSCGAATLGVTS